MFSAEVFAYKKCLPENFQKIATPTAKANNFMVL